MDEERISSENCTSIWMLAAHDPHLDPRVDWAASTAAKLFDVKVLGLYGAREGLPAKESLNGYEISRIAPGGSIIDSVRTMLTRMFFEGESLTFKVAVTLIGTLCVALWLLLLPLFIVVEVVWRGLGALKGIFEFLFRDLSSTRLIRRHVKLDFPLRSAKLETRMKELSARRAANWQLFVWTVNHVLTTGANFSNFLSELEHPPAVVHCNDLDTLVAGCLHKYITGTPVVYDSHENWPYSNVEASGYHIWFFRKLEGLLIRRCDAVVTVSEPLAEFLANEYKIRKVHVVPNAEPWRGRPQGIAAHTEMTELANGRLKLLFQGGFSPERGLEEVVDAWREVDGERAALFLRGHANTGAYDGLRQRVIDYQLLNKSIYFLPPVDEDNLVAAAREADVGLIPYKPHSPAYVVACPNKLSQYMHAGLPILSTDLPYVEKVLREGDCGITYSVDRISTFVDAVEQLVGDQERISEMSDNALKHGENVFNWQKFGGVFTSLYGELSRERNLNK